MRISVFFVILTIISIESGHSASVSPKLDFASESEEISDEKATRKFYGVHVIVDTTKLKRTSDPSSSDESINSRKNEKTIGIRTDITFEIPAKKSNVTGNETKSTENESSGTSEDDTVVPVFKGRDSDSDREVKFTPREKQDWNPLFLPNNYEGFWTTERAFLPLPPPRHHRPLHTARMKPFVPYMIGQNEKMAVIPLFKPQPPPCRCDSFDESDRSLGSRSDDDTPPFGNIYFVPKYDSVDDKLDGPFKTL
ncbi:hypothetical protein DMENIID0001_113280 [Sergentomyia squamirostris]